MVFDYILNDKDETEFQVKCSFLEIYKEILYKDQSAYRIDRQQINYNTGFKIEDHEGGILIECVIGSRN